MNPNMHNKRTPTATDIVSLRWAINVAMVRRMKRCTGEFITPSAFFFVSLTGSHDLAHTGTWIKASTQLTNRLTHSTRNKSLAYSPTEPGQR